MEKMGNSHITIGKTYTTQIPSESNDYKESTVWQRVAKFQLYYDDL